PDHQARVLCLDRDWPTIAEEPDGEPGRELAPGHLAYVIYTSGSTGKPKGAMNTHAGVCNRLLWMQGEYRLTPADVVLQKTPFSFDVSVWEFFWPLMTGAQLVMARPGGHRDTTYLAEVMTRHRVTVCHFVPSMLRAFLAGDDAARCTTLRDVMASGEALAPDLVATFHATLPNARLHNLYGPTECAVDVSYWPCPQSATPPAIVPIGRAVANTRLYVLDPRGEPTPIGVPGELFLAGVQVGLGYHGRPELTAEKFVPDPFAGSSLLAPRSASPDDDVSEERGATREARARMYRTGDRARWLADGTVEYLGRLDFQVKVRGFRIELGEIETVLLAHATVRDCVVVAREGEGGEKRLVAYVVTSGERPAVSALRAFLGETLPDHMVPGAFVFLDALPLSSNGKVDRRALPDPQLEASRRARAYEAPRTDAERALAEIWARVLRVERVGLTDDFFELGGDSLLSIQIVSQAARSGLKLTLTQVLQQPTVGGQARVAQAVAARTTPNDPSDDVIGPVPLTPVQRWFFEGQREQAHHWNQAFIFTVPSGFDAAAFARAIDAVTRRHDSLRLRYERDGDAWRQRCVAEPAPATVDVHELGDLPEGTRCDAMAEHSVRVQGSLDLAHGPLLRAALFRLTPGRTERLLIAVHHLAIDGVSWRVLREDLEAAYLGQPLAARTTPFGRWATALAAPAVRDAQRVALRVERAYWERAGAPGVRLSRDIEPQGEDYAAYTDTVVVRLDEAETRALLQAVPAAYNTQINDALLAALSPALAGVASGAGELVVNLEGHGREDAVAGADLSRTLGWFTTIFPVRLPLGAATPAERLKDMKERLRAVPGRGFGYGVLRYLEGVETLQAQPTPDVVFNYMGQFDQVLAGSTVFGYSADGTGSWYGARTRRRHLLEINGMVIDGRLELRWSFSGRAHRRETIARMADAYVAALRAIVAHCTVPGAGGYTPSDFPLARLDQAALDRTLGPAAAGGRDVADVYPATPLQRLFLDAKAGASDPGFQQYAFELTGDVDPRALGEAWQTVVQRHDVLRTRFVTDAGTPPLAVVQRHAAMPWRVEDWRGVDAADRLTRLLHDDRTQGLDATRAPLMRATLVRTDDARCMLVWTQHHLLLDRWSWPIVLREVGTVYAARHATADAPLAAAPRFRDYVAWLQAQPARAAESYWREELDGVNEPLRLTTSVETAPPGWDEIVVELTAEETTALRNASRVRGLAANVAVEGAWAIALAHLGARDDVTFGLAVAGRGAEVAGIESLVGVTINNVPVRARLDDTTPAAAWLAALQRRQAELRTAEHASLEEIQRWSGIPWRHRLFESLLVFQDRAAETGMAGWLGAAATLRAVATPTETAYPITLLVTGDDRLVLTLLCDRRLVAPALGEQLAAATVAALRAMAAGDALDAPLGALRGALPTVRAWRDAAVMVERVAPRTATEAVLTKIWGELLGAPDLGVTDNFLARGGHSLLATQIVSRVRETLHLEVPVRVLFQAPTVADFARALTALERKPGQVERIAQLVQRIDGMSADELRQAAAAREGRARQTATVHGD
ncbi:MAG: amino acid adenylation domain-containing protein, partial [Gemmatirosa sp.]|nr:amino acid adenylation domain-containing protein [Gemmatirosa sp.]